MLSLLRTGRWIAFTAAAVLAIVAFGLLSLWQWHRAEEKRAEFGSVSAAMAAEPVAVTAAARPDEWQRVTASGSYDAAEQFLVRNRPQNGSNGFWVVTRFDTTGGESLWVVRGFLPVAGAATASLTAPAPPSGEQTMTAYARASEPGPVRAADDLPAGQVTAVTVADLDELGGTSTVPWFAVSASRTEPGLQPIPVPEPSDGRNVSYAGQWLLFAAITIGGWYYFLRREAQESGPEQPVEASRIEVGG